MSDLERRRAAKMRNLAIANKVKAKRKELRLLVRDRKIDAVKLIGGEYEQWEPVIERWPLSALIRLVPGVGRVTEAEIYAVGKFSPNQRLLALNQSRRQELARLCAEGRRLHGFG